jgi:hypothetical protein
MFKRKCPKCNRTILYTSQYGFKRAIKYNTNCIQCRTTEPRFIAQLRERQRGNKNCIGKRNGLKHGDSQQFSPHFYLYKLWQHIRDRCLNPNNDAYHHYGGRGITVYKSWIMDYLAFKTYILSTIGERPLNHSLDRIDNNRSYVPGNLRWATPSQQSSNQRKSKHLF